MYIWRGKNRRDRRNLLTSAAIAVWGPSKKEANNDASDILLRYEGESQHIDYFSKKIHLLMHNYLNTANGKEEIDYMVKYLDSSDRVYSLDEIDEDGIRKSAELMHEEGHDKGGKIEKKVPPEMLKKNNIYEVFRKYDADGSGSIDRNELVILLKELNVPMKEKEIDELMEELDSDGGGGIDFEEFYTWFVSQAENQRKKNRLEYFKSALKGGVFDGFKRLVLEVEARNLLIDVAVEQAEHGARTEYRTARPAEFLCDMCPACFPTVKALSNHRKDTEFHEKYKEKKNELDLKTYHVTQIFAGEQGRHFNAMRLMFSTELLPMEERIKATKLAPFRPRKLDPGGKRFNQLLKGMYVTGGNDAKAGIRTAFRKFGLFKQHRAPGRTPDQPLLTDLLVEMLYTRDEKIDIVTCPDISVYAPVRFQWNGSAQSQIQILGEFNNWKPEDLENDGKIGKCFCIKHLGPGKYRYRYKIDGVEKIDEDASILTDSFGTNNVILVINPLTEGKQLQGIRHINLRNNALHDDGAWAFAGFMQHNTTITSIDLGNNNISDEGIMAVTSTFNKIPMLKEVNLSGNGFGFDSARYLAKAFIHSRTIMTLILSSNRLGDDGTEILCNSLIKHHASIRTLVLDANLIGNDGATSIAEALEKNRVLTSLSLNNNNIFADGAERLAFFLQWNSTLTDLKLNHNPLGPFGVKHIGDMLATNNTIKNLDLSNTFLVKNKLATGLISLCYGLKKCRSLTSLSIRNNEMDDDHIVEIGQVLVSNKTLLQLDFSGNPCDNKWFQPNKYFHTRLMRDMPSLQTSIDSNRITMKDPAMIKKYSVKGVEPVQGDEYEGQWNHLRKWQNINRQLLLKQMLKESSGHEQERIDMEHEFISEHLQKHMAILQKFIDSSAGVKYVQLMAKVIAEHIKLLAFVEPEPPPPPPIPEPPSFDDVEVDGPDIANLRGALAKARLLQLEELKEAKRKEWEIANAEAVEAAKQAIIQAEEDRKNRKLKVEVDEAFMVNHITIIVALFKECGADHRYLLLHPEKLQHVFQALCLPLKPEDAQPAVDGSIVAGAWKIGCRKFANYILSVGKSIADKNKRERNRFLTDLHYHPPIQEAKAIILDNEAHKKRKELQKQYRSLQGKKPLYCCHFCGIRFTSEKSFQKHKDKRGGSEHKRHIQELEIYDLQDKFLNNIKFLLTGSHFPTFYQLAPEKDLPKEYFPQIFDVMGFEGRPIGVVEPNVTIRVQDIMGDYLQVCYEGNLGWARYRMTSLFGKTIKLLRPALSDVPHFSWDGLKMIDFGKQVYYKVCDDLPKKTQLKVRELPLLSAESIGFLEQGQVVQVGAIFNDWLQIKYEKIASAWVLYKVGGGGIGPDKVDTTNAKPLLFELPPELQRKMSHICICSPFRVTEKMLQADDEIERLHEEEMKLIREASGDLVKIDDDEKEDEEDM